jgi:hypothetical protein
MVFLALVVFFRLIPAASGQTLSQLLLSPSLQVIGVLFSQFPAQTSAPDDLGFGGREGSCLLSMLLVCGWFSSFISLLRLLRMIVITNIAGWAGGSVTVVAWSHFNRQPASSDVYTGIDVVSGFLAWGWSRNRKRGGWIYTARVDEMRSLLMFLSPVTSNSSYGRGRRRISAEMCIRMARGLSLMS